MATPTHNEIIDENCSLDRTPSGRFITRSRPSSFRTISMEPISPTGPPTGMNSFRMPPMRTRSLKRNNRYEKIIMRRKLLGPAIISLTQHLDIKNLIDNCHEKKVVFESLSSIYFNHYKPFKRKTKYRQSWQFLVQAAQNPD